MSFDEWFKKIDSPSYCGRDQKLMQDAWKAYQPAVSFEDWLAGTLLLVTDNEINKMHIAWKAAADATMQNPTLRGCTRQRILEEAIKCVTKDRNATHGEPEDNFLTIANYWTNYWRAKDKNNFPIFSAVDVAAMMVLMKASRLATSPDHADHWIDIAGYSACGGEIACSNE